jgi:hypothetical protein
VRELAVLVSMPPTIIPPIPKQYLECIGQGSIVSNSQDFDMTGMDSSVDKWYLLLMSLKNGSASTTNYFMYFAGDYTDANYRSEYVEGAGTTCTVSGTATPNFAGLLAGRCMMTRADIVQDVDNKTRASTYSNRYNISTELSVLSRVIGRNVAGSFTTMRIHADQVDGIGAGSKFYLYRYKGII